MLVFSNLELGKNQGRDEPLRDPVGSRRFYGFFPERISVRERQLQVVLKSLRVALLLVLSAWFWGCSAIVPERKTPSDSPRIHEEDVTDDRAARPETGDEAPAGVGESLPSAEGVPPAVQPHQRSPHRYKWRDKKGSLKGWESSTEGSRGREP